MARRRRRRPRRPRGQIVAASRHHGDGPGSTGAARVRLAPLDGQPRDVIAASLRAGLGGHRRANRSPLCASSLSLSDLGSGHHEGRMVATRRRPRGSLLCAVAGTPTVLRVISHQFPLTTGFEEPLQRAVPPGEPGDAAGPSWRSNEPRLAWRIAVCIPMVRYVNECPLRGSPRRESQLRRGFLPLTDR